MVYARTNTSTTAAATITWSAPGAAVRWKFSRRRLTDWNRSIGVDTITQLPVTPSRSTESAGLPQEEHFASSGLRKTMPIACRNVMLKCPTMLPFAQAAAAECGFPARKWQAFAPSARQAARCGTPAASTSRQPSKPAQGQSRSLPWPTSCSSPQLSSCSLSPSSATALSDFTLSSPSFSTVATILVATVMRILYSVLALIPVAGFLLAWLAVAVTVLGWVIGWLVLLVKVLQGGPFRLPIIGALAEKQAGA